MEQTCDCSNPVKLSEATLKFNWEMRKFMITAVATWRRVTLVTAA